MQKDIGLIYKSIWYKTFRTPGRLS